MKASKKLSVITASYNSEYTISRTIESILEQSYTNIEYIIVDGASNDQTLSIIDKYRKHILDKVISFKLLSERDNGIADAWNKGLQFATGEVIFFLNSDDWIEYDSISKAMRNFEQNGNMVLYGRCNRYNVEEFLVGSYQKRFFRGRELWNFGFSFTTCFIGSEVFDKLGGFNSDFKIAIDSEFLLRCIKNKVKFLKGDHTVNMREGGVSLNHRDLARQEFRSALLKYGYPSFLVNLIDKIQKKIKKFN